MKGKTNASQKFIAKARELGVDERASAFDAVLKRVATAKPKGPARKKRRKKG